MTSEIEFEPDVERLPRGLSNRLLERFEQEMRLRNYSSRSISTYLSQYGRVMGTMSPTSWAGRPGTLLVVPIREAPASPLPC